MGLNCSDYKLIIIEKYPTSFLAQGQVHFGKWLINEDDSLGDFLRAPNDYVDQIKLTLLEVYVRKEPRLSCRRSPLSNDVFPQLVNRKSPEIAPVTQVPVTQSSDSPCMSQYQNIFTSGYDFDLNRTVDKNDWKNITQDQANVPANIDNVDQPNYRSSSQNGSDYLPNADESEDEISFVASSSDDEFMTLNRSARSMSMSPTHVEESLPP
ncbi:hypothetical protein BC332_13385 [Capsicum chinense]|nr:hypothetical protein BC332_13385 [Capsicum chinense]